MPRFARSTTVLLHLLLALCALAGVPRHAHAQAEADRPAVDILLPPSDDGVLTLTTERGPLVTTRNILSGGEVRELIRSGFPAELRFRLELWRAGGWFDDLESILEWSVIVAYDPAAQLYRVRRLSSRQNEDLGAFATLTSVEAVLARPVRAPVIPRQAGRRYYYNLVLEVEALSVSDLDQLERWLRGELRPAVRGRNNPVDALSSGVKTMVTRVLGGERREYRRRSGGFRAGEVPQR